MSECVVITPDIRPDVEVVIDSVKCGVCGEEMGFSLDVDSRDYLLINAWPCEVCAKEPTK